MVAHAIGAMAFVLLLAFVAIAMHLHAIRVRASVLHTKAHIENATSLHTIYATPSWGYSGSTWDRCCRRGYRRPLD